MKDHLQLGSAGPTGLGGAGNPHEQRRVRLLKRLVQAYAWCHVPPRWPYSLFADYLLVIQLPNGRRYWRFLASSERTPDEVLLCWASCSPDKWKKQFCAGGESSKPWNACFDP